MTRHINGHVRTISLSLVASIALAAAPPALAAQSDILIQARSGTPMGDRFRVDSAGGLIALGVAGGNCTIPASGSGTRFMWYPCRGAFRFGRVPDAQFNWDDANIGDFTFAGGDQVTASGKGAFGFGQQVTVSSVGGTGFGAGVTVSGIFGFAAGFNNKCTGYTCTAIGQKATAGGEGAVAIGTGVTANNNFTVALGYRASTNGKSGSFVWGDGTIQDTVRNQANNEFRIRASGGIKLRTSTASNAAPGVVGNTGCDLPAGSGSWTCASSRDVKENVDEVDGEDVLAKVRELPVTTWNYIAEGREVRHMGPFAQDFHAAFKLGPDSTSIGMIDINGVNLAAIKALEQRTSELRASKAALDVAMQRLEQLEERIEKLEKALQTKRR